jgi:myb proto-oncogene protein
MEQFGWGREEGGWRKGPWTAQEDKLLLEYVRQQGEGRWNSVSKLTGTDDSFLLLFRLQSSK